LDREARPASQRDMGGGEEPTCIRFSRSSFDGFVAYAGARERKDEHGGADVATRLRTVCAA
jgi:hypothetical protein